MVENLAPLSGKFLTFTYRLSYAKNVLRFFFNGAYLKQREG